MILYHYRSINEYSLEEIEKGTFYFATHEELNDPIEGYVKVFWQGDKFAWEGLLRNYIYSLAQTILQYLCEHDIHVSPMINMKQFNNVPLDEILHDLGATFLIDNEIEDLTTFYGQQKIKVNENVVRIILYFVHNKALRLCISKYSELNLIPKENADKALEDLARFEIHNLPFGKINENPPDAKSINIISQISTNLLDDLLELHYMQSRLNDNEISSGAKQFRNWMTILVDFPKLYVHQLKNMIYPESYVVCFSRKNNNSAMWGNYANRHKGICLIYETDENNMIQIRGEHNTFKLQAKPILYEGNLIERNFFETFGRLTRAEVKAWLTGADGSISSSFEAFKDEDQWRHEYWKTHEIKTYQKLKAWESEQEYRIVLTNTFHDFSTQESRKLQYDPKCLRGIIFGISTPEADKKQIMEKLIYRKDKYSDFTFYQAEFDNENQTIIIREKKGWKI